jgi:hypothetical protein
MEYGDVWRPSIRLATAVVFMVAALLVPAVEADDPDTCNEAIEYCYANQGYLTSYMCYPWPGEPRCQTCLYSCTYGPIYSACDYCLPPDPE